MTAGLVTVVVRLFSKSRADRITYIRSFKRGKGALIYLVALPLYWAGLIYAGEEVFPSFFNAVRRIIELVVLKYDVAPINALVADCPIFAVAVYVCFVLVGLNAMLFALSLMSQYLWNGLTNLIFSLSKKPRLIIFGNNKSSKTIYASEKERSAIIIDKVVDKDALDMYLDDVVYHSVTDKEKYAQKVVKSVVKSYRPTIVVINTGDEETNIAISRVFAKTITSLSDAEQSVCFGKLRIFVYGDAKFEAIYVDIIQNSNGCISYLNKYQKIAIDFIDRYPFSKFLTEEHVDYKTSLIKEGVDLNAFFIGFGKTNQQIFLTSVANNQFIEKNKDEVVIKKVKYHIFDKYPAEHDKNLNHNYNRYKNECMPIPDKDDVFLPLPDYPAEEVFHHFSVSDMSFYNTIRSTATANLKSANFIIIAFGDDLENIDMAQKLCRKCQEWEVKNIHVFVKVRKATPAKLLDGIPNCYVIGNEADSVYDVEKIVGDALFCMARKRDEIYAVEYDLKKATKPALTPQYLEQKKASVRTKWYKKKTQIERDSSIYASLSLRSKLNLMGLDYVPEDDKRVGLTPEEYLDVYAMDDRPDYDHYATTFDGKPIVYYDIDFKSSRRTNMAIHEHLRWNSYMISQGVIPATIDQILNDTEKGEDGKEYHTNGKSYPLRRHGNITTFKGLVRFRKLIAERDYKEGDDLKTLEMQNDVIMYDYQLLDDAYYILKVSGYKIVRR